VACWHQQAGWVRPAQLVQAQLHHPQIRVQAHAVVARLQRSADGRWQALDADGRILAEADLAVLACGPATADLLPHRQPWPLQPIRGQISWGLHTADNASALPPFPVNGNGNLVTHIPQPQDPQHGEIWVMGSTFERDVTAMPISAADQAAAHAVNHGKLSTLLPASGAAMAPGLTRKMPAAARPGAGCGWPATTGCRSWGRWGRRQLRTRWALQPRGWLSQHWGEPGRPVGPHRPGRTRADAVHPLRRAAGRAPAR
jgi:hypothetical protein